MRHVQTKLVLRAWKQFLFFSESSNLKFDIATTLLYKRRYYCVIVGRNIIFKVSSIFAKKKNLKKTSLWRLNYELIPFSVLLKSRRARECTGETEYLLTVLIRVLMSDTASRTRYVDHAANRSDVPVAEN